MTDRELMQQALEALEMLAKYENPLTKIQVRKPRDGGPIVTMYPHKVATEAAAPLRERLAQPEQEPVAEVKLMMTGGNAGIATVIHEIDNPLRERLRPGDKLFTTPQPQRKPLTNEQADSIINGLRTCLHLDSKRMFLKTWLRDWAAHGIKE